MRRRWFGVFLTLFSSISMLLFAVPAYAYSECHWVDTDHILCDGSANFIRGTQSQGGSFLLNGNITQGVINGISSDFTKAKLTVMANNMANTTDITLKNPENASAGPGTNPGGSAASCDWVDKTTIACGTDKYTTNDGGKTYSIDTSHIINQISADHTKATQNIVTGSGATLGTSSNPVNLTNPQNATKDPAPDPNAKTALTTCHSSNSFSWLVCGAISAMLDVVDAIRDNIIVPFLNEKPVDSNNPEYVNAYHIWSAFRNIASIFFILVFFLIIIGTATGFDNYTIKKVLPHLVAGAILVPFSWYFCAFIIDIGNVLGDGIVKLMNSILPHGSNQISISTSFTGLFLTATVVGGFALVGAAAQIGFGLIVTILLGFLGIFVTLILRKIFIILCIVLSPFAILAWILPNTSKWFKEWWQNFFKLVMMYPIVMLLFEAGRIFSATAGASAPVGGESWAVPTLQIAGLVLPLFAVPFAFKFAGKGLAMGNNMVGRATGSLDKRFGKDSDMAKVAAQNRKMKNMFRGKDLEGKGTTRLGKLGYGLAARAAYRRAGAPKPFSGKATGFGSNPAGLIAHEEAYGAAQAALGKASSTNEKKLQGLPGETAKARLEAETQMALNQKIAGQAEREGIVRNANELGLTGLSQHNKAILEAGADKKRIDQKQKGAGAMGYNIEAINTPLNNNDIIEHAKRMAEAQELEGRANLHGELEMLVDMDQKIARDHPGISMRDAHNMRMENLRKSAGTKAGNKLLDHDKEAWVQTEYSRKATEAEVARQAALGHTITDEQAGMNRMDAYYAAEVSKGVNAKLTDEGKDLLYNEVEEKAGGPLSGFEVMNSARANNRDAMTNERAKLETGHLGDKTTTQEKLDAARYATSKSFGDSEGDTEALLRAREKEAALNNIDLTTPGGQLSANLAASDRSFRSRTNTESRKLIKAVGQQESVINTEKHAIARAKRLASRAGVTLNTNQARNQLLDDTMTAARVTGGRAAAAEYAQDEAIVNDRIQTPLSQSQVYEAALQAANSDVGVKTGNILAGARVAAAEARTAGLQPGSKDAALHAVKEVAEAARLNKEKQLSQHIADERAVIDANDTVAVSPDQYMTVGRDEQARQLVEKSANLVGASNQLEKDIQAEMTPGVSRQAAEAAVRDRRLENVKLSSEFQGEAKAQRAIDAEANVASATEREIAAEEAAVALTAPAGTDIRREAVKNLVQAAGTAAGLEAGRKAGTDIAKDKAVAKEFRDDVQKEIDGGATPAAAEATVRERRLSNAANAEGSKAARQARKDNRRDAGIAKDNNKKIQKQIKKNNGDPNNAQDIAKAEREVLSADLEAVGEDAAITSAHSNRTEVSKAKGTVEAVKAKTEEAYKELRKAQGKAMAAAGMDRDSIKTIMAANKQADLDAAEDTTFEDIQDEAGEAARIGAQDTQAQLMGRDKGTVKENQANLDQAPVERARNEAIRARYEKEQQKVYDAAKNAALAAGATPEAAEAAGEAAKKDDKNLLKVRKLADKAGDVARKKTLKDVKAGRISENEKLQNKIVSIQRAAEEQAIRAEANTQGTIIGMNQAASAPGALTAAERLASKSTSAAVSLAAESGNERAQLEMAGEGQTYHRSYATAEEAQTRAKQEQILRERVDQAGQKMVTFVKDGDTITDKISNVDLSNEAADQMAREIKNYDNLNLGPDDIAARIRSLGRSSYGADKLREIKNTIFGGNRGRTVDPDKFNGQAKTIWDIGIAGINRDGNPDLFVPEIASFDGVNVEKLAKMNDRTKGVLMDYAEDMASSTVHVPQKKVDASGNPVPRLDFAQNVGNSITDIFKNQNTSKNVSLKDLKAMAERMFVKDASGKYQTTVYNPDSAIVKHMLNIKDKDGNKLGEDALQIIADKLKDANLGV